MLPPSMTSCSHTLLGRILDLPIKTLTNTPATRSPGSIRDFYSEADYWWPDPLTGQYCQKDGKSNPECFNRHRKLLIRMSCQIGYLASAYLATHAQPTLQRLQNLTHAWFVAPDTAMSPSLSFSQAIRGQCAGRSYGIIDTIHLAEVAVALTRLRHTLSAQTLSPIYHWFDTYLQWLVNSDFGQTERQAENNHGICWYLQAAAFATLLQHQDMLQQLRHDFLTHLLTQIDHDGSLPRELSRTKPYGYALFTLEAFTGLAALLSTPDLNAFLATGANGSSLADAVKFMYPFIRDKQRWPLPPDVNVDGYWPVKQSSLFLTGNAIGEENYLRLWETLPDIRLKFELLRNFPIRHPWLWLPHAQGTA